MVEHKSVPVLNGNIFFLLFVYKNITIKISPLFCGIYKIYFWSKYWNKNTAAF